MTQNNVFKVAMWIGLTKAVMAVVAHLLEEPSLKEYNELLNFVGYAATWLYGQKKKK